MKTYLLAVLCATLAAPMLVTPANAQLPKAMAELPPLTETSAQRDARMQWWRDAKFGLFIHWGPVALKGVEIGWGRKAPRTYDQLYPMIYKLQPDILVNDRGAKFCGRGRDKKQSTLSQLPESREARKIVNGDFYTPEQRIGGMDLNRDWESCITICKQWAWKPNDTMKSFSECIRTLVTSVSGGGNLLFNVGPMPTGEIEPRQVERLKEMGAWLGKYGNSLYGTRGGPYRNGRWGGCPHKDKTVWLHVFEWNGDKLQLPALPAKVVAIKALTGGTPIFQQTGSGLDITLAKSDQDPVNTVIELTLDQATVLGKSQ